MKLFRINCSIFYYFSYCFTFLVFFMFSLGSVLEVSGKVKTYEKIPILGFHDVVNLNSAEDIPPNRRSFSMDYTKKELQTLFEYLLNNNYYFLTTNNFYELYLEPNKKNNSNGIWKKKKRKNRKKAWFYFSNFFFEF